MAMAHEQHFHRSILYQYLATASGTLVSVTAGMHFGWPSPSLPQLLSNNSPIPITSSEGSWIAATPCMGGPFGSMLAGLIVDKIGRKYSLLIASPLYFCAWLAVAYSPNLLILSIARFSVGIIDGLTFIVLPMYVGEISDRRVRGFLSCSISTTFAFGFLLINIFGLYYSIKITALLSSLVPILHFLTFVWMPESPYYYLIHHKHQNVITQLKKFSKGRNVEEDFRKLREEHNLDATGSKKYLNLFKLKSNRRALLVAFSLRLIQQFSGSYTISFYCLTIFNEAGGFVSGRTATLLYFSVQLVASTLSTLLVDKTGRRPLLIISIIGAGLALTVQGAYFYFKQNYEDIAFLSFLPLTALLVYNIAFNIGLGTVPGLLLGELFPTDVKAFALSLVDLFYNVVTVIASKFFQIVNDAFGMYVPFFTFAGFCAVGLIVVMLVVPETRGKTLEQIQRESRGANVKPNKICGVEVNADDKSLLN